MRVKPEGRDRFLAQLKEEREVPKRFGGCARFAVYTDPADRRSWLISLTPRGRSRTDRLFKHAVTDRQLVFDGFRGDELAALATALDRIDHNVRRLRSDRAAA